MAPTEAMVERTFRGAIESGVGDRVCRGGANSFPFEDYMFTLVLAISPHLNPTSRRRSLSSSRCSKEEWDQGSRQALVVGGHGRGSLDAITLGDARGFFGPCGYRALAQSL